MKKMKRLFWLLPCLLTMLVTGCLKDNPNGETIVLMGDESNVKLIGEVIPDTLLVFIADTAAMGDSLVLNLPTGNTPPDIQGQYVFGPRTLYKYNGDHPVANDSIYLRFGGEQAFLQVLKDHHYHAGDILIQGEDTLTFTADTTIQVMDSVVYYPDGQNNKLVPCDIYRDIKEKGNVFLRKQVPAYVVGRGNDFTVYFTVEYDCEEELSGLPFTLKRGYILTGTIAADGIEHAVLACVNIEAKPDGTSTTVPSEAIQSMENRIYVYRVRKLGNPNAFGTAVRYQWY